VNILDKELTASGLDTFAVLTDVRVKGNKEVYSVYLEVDTREFKVKHGVKYKLTLEEVK